MFFLMSIAKMHKGNHFPLTFLYPRVDCVAVLAKRHANLHHRTAVAEERLA